MDSENSDDFEDLDVTNTSGNDTDYDIYEYELEDSYSNFNWAELGPNVAIFAITFILGIIGNCLILVAVIRHTHVKNSPVNVFLASLASADLLLILVCLPLKVAKLFSYTWTMGEFSCKLLYYMQSISGICSVLNLTALSIERYYVIVHPLKAQYLCTISKAKKTILLTWLSAFILAIPILLGQVHMKVGERVVAYWCVRDFDSPRWWIIQEVYFLIVILVIPTFVMGFSYGKIIVEICRVVKQRHKMTGSRHDRTGRKKEQIELANIIKPTEIEEEVEEKPPPTSIAQVASMLEDAETGAMLKIESSDIIVGDAKYLGLQIDSHYPLTSCNSAASTPKMDNETKQVIRMLISIVITFVICWCPILIFNVLHAFGTVEQFMGGLGGWEKHLKSIFSLMAYLNSCLNPIIYGFMSKSFRKSFASELRACYCCFKAMNQDHQGQQREEGQTMQHQLQQENTGIRPLYNTTTAATATNMAGQQQQHQLQQNQNGQIPPNSFKNRQNSIEGRLLHTITYLDQNPINCNSDATPHMA